MQITWSMYKRKPVSFWIGRKVRLTEPIENSYWRAEAGVVVTITNKHGGFAVEYRSKCTSCEISKVISMTGLTPDLVELFNPNDIAIFTRKKRCPKI